MIQKTKYYEDFLGYYEKSKLIQEHCNIGDTPYIDAPVDDDLMRLNPLFDFIQHYYSGISRVNLDMWFGWSEQHPYWNRMQNGKILPEREELAKKYNTIRHKYGMEEWLYLFLVHTVTGSGVNYNIAATGYYNSILFHLHECETIEEMAEVIRNFSGPYCTSIGCQFPRFPKPPKVEPTGFIGLDDYNTGFEYKRNCDYYCFEYAPRLVRDLTKKLTGSTHKLQFRELLDWMNEWNANNGLARYTFQYSLFIGDICDFWPEYMETHSLSHYGSNTQQCMSYLATPTTKMSKLQFGDELMLELQKDTGLRSYDLEDLTCDYIRWVENYVRTSKDYSHLDLDNVWNSSSITDHPYGRQKPMLELGLVETFNIQTEAPPSGDKIITQHNLTIDQYKKLVQKLH